MLSAAGVAVAVATIVFAFSIQKRYPKIHRPMMINEKPQSKALSSDISEPTIVNLMVYNQKRKGSLLPQDYLEHLATFANLNRAVAIKVYETEILWKEKEIKVKVSGISGPGIDQEGLFFEYPPDITQVPRLEETSSTSEGNPAPTDTAQGHGPLPLKRGQILISSELALSFGINKGDTIFFNGNIYKVKDINKQRGSREDSVIWMPMQEIRKLCKLQGDQVNAVFIYGLQIPRMETDNFISEIKQLVPATEIIPFTNKTASGKGIGSGEDNLQSFNKNKASIERLKKQSLYFVPGILFLAALWVAILAGFNTVHRQKEIKTLYIMGCKTLKSFTILIMRGFLIGLIGGITGIIVGIAFSLQFAYNTGAETPTIFSISSINPVIFFPSLVLLTLILTTAVASPSALKALKKI